MIRKNKWKLAVASLITVLPMLFGFIVMGSLGEKIPGHWNFFGKVDGFVEPIVFVAVLPLTLLAVFWIGVLLTAKDIQKRPQNDKVINMIIALVPAISLYISVVMYAIAFGYEINVSAVVLIMIGAMLIFVGNYLPKCSRNRTVGIRIKWTLQNEDNWNKTHRFAGKVSVILGVCALLAAFLPSKLFPFATVGILVLEITLVAVYSYSYYQKQLKTGEYIEDDYFEGEEGSSKRVVASSLVVTALVLVFCGVMMFTGNVQTEFGEESLYVDATYNSEITIKYADIESVEYLEQHNAGRRMVGFGSPVLGVGSFESEQFGSYTRCAYTKCSACIVIKANDKTFVINGETTEATQAIYNELLTKIPTE